MPVSQLSVHFDVGQREREVELTLYDDDIAERPESFYIHLSLAEDDQDNEIGDIGQAQIEIKDDEILNIEPSKFNLFNLNNCSVQPASLKIRKT